MATKRATLSAYTAQKPQAPATPAAAPESSAPAKAKAAKDDRKGMTLRLSDPAWKQLKILAAEEGRHAHDLILESLNAVYEKHGKPPIA
jgi:hypothetical protein